MSLIQKNEILGMEIDSLVRVIRAPFFGKIGKVVDPSAGLETYGIRDNGEGCRNQNR